MKIKPRTKKAIVLSVMVVLLVATGAKRRQTPPFRGDPIKSLKKGMTARSAPPSPFQSNFHAD